MAKQNFVSGGFYGKLGQMVGQRWKNKRTIRSYAIPTNPRTEKQQANRHVFGAFTANAQLGQQMNFKAPCFISESQTEWGLRMNQASNLYKAGQQNMNLIPLFPNGYSPTYQITSYMLMARPSDSSVRIRIKGTLPSDARKISVLVAFYDSTITGYDFELYNATTIPGENTEFIIENTIASKYDATTHLILVSNDDAEHNNAMLYGAENALAIYAKTRRAFNFGTPTVNTSTINYDSTTDRYTMTTTVIFTESYAESEQEITNLKVHCVKNGVFTDINYDSVVFTNQNGFFGISFTSSNTNPAQISAFPVGSSISVEKLQVETETEILTAENTTIEISNADLTRNYKSQITATEQNGKTITLTLGEQLPTVSTISGGVSLYSVKAGRFTTELLNVSTVSTNKISMEIADASGINQNALPAGSTAIINAKFVSNGVTYSPTNTTAQAVSTSDLTRTFNISDGARTESANGFEISFSLYVDDFTFNGVSLNQYSTLMPFGENVKVGTYETTAKKDENGNLNWKVTGHYGNYIKNAVFNPPASYKANGVTYNISPFTYGSVDTSGTPFVITFSSDDYSGGEVVTKRFTALNNIFAQETGFTLESFVAPFEVEDYSIKNPPLYARGVLEDGREVSGVKLQEILLALYTDTDGSVVAGTNYLYYDDLTFSEIYEIAGSADMRQVGEVTIPLQSSSTNQYARGVTLRFA